MKKLLDDKEDDFKIPNDVPEGFFDVVSKVLNFIEDVDEMKNKLKN